MGWHSRQSDCGQAPSKSGNCHREVAVHVLLSVDQTALRGVRSRFSRSRTPALAASRLRRGVSQRSAVRGGSVKGRDFLEFPRLFESLLADRAIDLQNLHRRFDSRRRLRFGAGRHADRQPAIRSTTKRPRACFPADRAAPARGVRPAARRFAGPRRADNRSRPRRRGRSHPNPDA